MVGTGTLATEKTLTLANNLTALNVIVYFLSALPSKGPEIKFQLPGNATRSRRVGEIFALAGAGWITDGQAGVIGIKGKRRVQE